LNSDYYCFPVIQFFTCEGRELEKKVKENLTLAGYWQRRAKPLTWSTFLSVYILRSSRYLISRALGNLENLVGHYPVPSAKEGVEIGIIRSSALDI
jgi:hypothetical protein